MKYFFQKFSLKQFLKIQLSVAKFKKRLMRPFNLQI